MIVRTRPLLYAAVLIYGFAASAFAAVPVHVVKSDLKPLIRAAVRSPVQFAVSVPHAVSTSTGGTWSATGQLATWTYAARVPTAVSLSFHAAQSNLPEAATLVVRGTKNTTSYNARDVNRGELWSRIQPGDALEFSLTVPLVERSKVVLNIVSLQAGYRSLGAGVTDHPYYRQLKSSNAGESLNSACVTNYECKVDASIAPQGSATVALVIGNLYQCTGTLVNDVPGDNTPYILTARHCETGQLGGGSPGAASTITVYWDATSPCNATLGSLYDFGIPTQTGAKTIVEQQDAWLIELNSNPVVADAQFAGFDASGGAVQGGYTVQHAEFYDKQFTAWFGQALPIRQGDTLATGYVSNFLETVNQIGNVGPGASGSALFDQNQHIVGALTLGRQTSDPSGYGSCPVANPTAPNGSNGVADFTSLAAVWNSTADTSSTTSSTTIKSVLDPSSTGTLVTASGPVQRISLTAITDYLSVGQGDELSWNAPGATTCTASGGTAGDNWSGTLAPSGSQSFTESSTGLTIYSLTCTFAGNRKAKASTSITWVQPAPNLSMQTPSFIWTTRPATLTWQSNLEPCSITGGGLALSNLPATGSTSTTQADAGDVLYTLTCGPTGNQGTISRQVSFVTPSLIFEQTGSDRILGQDYQLWWRTYADSCVGSGGAPGDGWGSTAFNTNPDDGVGAFLPHVSTVGTYTYTLTCSSGDISVDQSLTVTFENNAPYVTASLSPMTVTYTDSPADDVTLTWNSNMSGCLFNSDPTVVFSSSDPLSVPYPSQAMATVQAPGPGTYMVSVTCGTQGNNPIFVTSTPITLTVLPPAAPSATLRISPSTVAAGQPYTVTWTSMNSNSCYGTGGIPMTGWETGAGFGPPAGSFTNTPISSQLGSFTFTLTCVGLYPDVAPISVQAQLTVASAGTILSANLQVDKSSVALGDSFLLTWSSTGASDCTASGGGANGTPWTGSIGAAGTSSQAASVVGSYTYTVICDNGAQSTGPQSVTVVVSQQASGSSTGGSHGGGTFGGIEFGLLSGLLLLRESRKAARKSARR